MNDNITTQSTSNDEMLHILNFLKDNMVSKVDFDSKTTDLGNKITDLDSKINEVRSELKAEISQTKNELMNHIDGFIGLHQKLDIELTALRAKCDRLEVYIKKMARHIQMNLS